MPIVPEELLNVLLQQLQMSAQRRPDLIADPRTQQVATYLGRVISPEDTPKEVMGRFPQAELETGGTAMQGSDLLKAAIPLAFWRRAPAEVKAGLTYAMNEQPELLRRALSIKDRILPELETRPTALGSAERLTPDVMALRIKPPPSNRPFLPGVREDVLAGTGTHELTHILQNPRVLATQADDAATIGKMLNEVIAQKDPWMNRGSLARSLHQLESVSPSDLPIAIQQIATSSGPTSRYGGLAGPRMTEKAAHSRLAMDEGLATLSEAVRDPRANSLLKILAERLGLGIAQKK
jgi:hypothetical protein